jgi:WD40 repeat protein
VNEERVLAHLERLEEKHRILALRVIATWERRGSPSAELVPAIGALLRPSWSSWHALVLAIREARRSAIRSRGERDGGAALAHVIAALEETLPIEELDRLRPLSELVLYALPRECRVLDVLGLPILLRNRIAHDAPREPAWWSRALEALEPIVALFESIWSAIEALDAGPPWFTAEGIPLASIQNDLSARSTDDEEISREISAPAVARLIGAGEAGEEDVRALLGRAAPEELKGVLLGEYLVGRVVGRGGFASVHEGRQIRTGKRVAVKILHDGMSEEVKERFRKEAALLSSFSHENIVQVIGHAEATWSPPRLFSLESEEWYREFAKGSKTRTFIALEWIDGATLEEAYRREADRPDARTIAGWFEQAARGLAAVHAAGLVHGDVKPENLMVTKSGAVKLMDFGVAREEGTEIAELGTLPYMAPETLRSLRAAELVGPRADVYGLAATFYELFTRARLYEHDRRSAELVRKDKLDGVPPEKPRALDWALEQILLGGLAPEPDDRYRDAIALHRDLARYLGDEPIGHRRPSVARRAALVYRRHRRVGQALIAIVISSLLGTAEWVRAVRAERAETTRARDRATTEASRAEAKANEARATLAEIYEEQARDRMTARDAERALAYVGAAAELGRSGETLALLADRAASSLGGLDGSIEVPARDLLRADFSFDGAWLYTSERSEIVSAYDTHTHRRLWTRPGGTAFSSGAGPRILVSPVKKSTSAVELLDLEGKRIAELARPDRDLSGSFSPDGAWVATYGGRKGVVRLWAAESGAFSGEVALSESLSWVSFSDRGETLALLGDRGTLSFFDVGSRRVLSSARAPEGASAVLFHPDGSAFVVTVGEIVRWDPKSGRALGSIRASGVLGSVSRLAEGERFIACFGSCTLYDAKSGRVVKSYFTEEGQQRGIQARPSPKGDRFAIFGAGSTKVVVHEALNGAAITELRAGTGSVNGVVWDRSGERIATLTSDGFLRFWAAKTSRPSRIPLGFVPDHSSFSPDGRRVLFFNSGTLAEVDLSSGAVTMISSGGKPYGIQHATFGSSGPIVITGEALMGFEPGSSSPAKTLPLGSTSVSHVFEAPGERVLLVEGGDVRLARADTLEVVARFDGGFDQIVSADLGRSLLAVGTRAGLVHVLRTRDLGLERKLSHERTVWWVKLSPDERRLAAFSEEGAQTVWNLESGAKVHTAPPRSDRAFQTRFSPDSRWFVAQGESGLVEVRDATTSAIHVTLSGHRGALRSAELARGGSLLLTTAIDPTGSPYSDGELRLWSLESGALLDTRLITLSYGNEPPAVFSPDGSSMIHLDRNYELQLTPITAAPKSSGDLAALAKRLSRYRVRDGALVLAGE